MAAIRFTHKERDEITIKIADYIILTGSSTRKTAAEFGLSNVTILTLMNKVLPNLDMQKYLKVQEILQKRGGVRGSGRRKGNFSRKYPFSSRLYCGFCGSLLTRRNWH